MNRERVESSSIASIGYDPGGQVLEVEFRNGSVFQYRSVPADMYEEFKRAPSVGRHFNQHIRPGNYSCFRVL
jgi:hypothetical protein